MMRYFLAIVLPPIAVLSCGKPLQAVLNLLLTLCLWAPGAVHACLVVHEHYSEKRTKRVIAAVRAQSA